MAASRKRNNKDGISIRDQWQVKGRQGGNRWLYRVWDSNERKYLARSFNSDAEVDANRRRLGCAQGDAWAAEMQSEMKLGMRSATRVTLDQVAKEYIAMCRDLGRSDGYLLTLERTRTYAGEAGIVYLDDERITNKVLHWLKGLEARRPGQKKGKPATNRTRNQHINVLKAFGKYAVENRRMRYNPFLFLRKYKEAQNPRQVYKLSELRLLLSDQHRDHEFWLYAVLLAYTGLRSNTVRQLTWGMMDWEANRIRVPAEITKQQFYVNTPIQPELRAILKPRSSVAKATILDARIAAITSDRANELMTKFLLGIGVEPKGRSIHAFRHTVVSILTATGMSPFAVMDAVGHSSTQTSKHYARGADEFREQIRREKWTEGEFYFRRTPPAGIKSLADAQGADQVTAS